MEAFERVVISNNWTAITFVFALVLLVLLKSLDSQKLKGFCFAIFNKGFVEIESQENSTFFTIFNGIFFLFTNIVVSLTCYFLVTAYSTILTTGFITFFKIFLCCLAYFITRWTLEILLQTLFLIKSETHFFFVSKISYLYTISFGFFILLIFYTYGYNNPKILVFGSLFLVIVRFIVLLINNKNLILNKLLYFILYLCTFEIAPLFILFKLIF